MVPLSNHFLVLVDELRLATADPSHVILQLLDLVNLTLPAIASGNLNKKYALLKRPFFRAPYLIVIVTI